MNQKKWGFRIYRTTYESDEQWTEFMRRFKAAIEIKKPWRTQDPFDCRYWEIPLDEGLMSCLDFQVVDDKEKFDRATRPQLIPDFNAWVASDEPKNEVKQEELERVYDNTLMVPFKAGFPYEWEKRAGNPQYLSSPRYRFFIQIDQECVESVLGVEDPEQVISGAKYNGWVNVVNSRWPLQPPMNLDGIFRPSPYDPEIEFDNGCWFRVTPGYLYPHLFASLTRDISTAEYLRPPRVAADSDGGFSPEHGKMVVDVSPQDDEHFRDLTADRNDGIWWTTVESVEAADDAEWDEDEDEDEDDEEDDSGED
jgi:hypothetical protein